MFVILDKHEMITVLHYSIVCCKALEIVTKKSLKKRVIFKSCETKIIKITFDHVNLFFLMLLDYLIK